MNRRKTTFSLRTRLTLLLAVAVLLALGGAAKIVDWRADADMQQRFDASLLASAESLASLVQVEGGTVAVDADDAAPAVFPGYSEASWYELRCGGRTVARTAQIPPAVPTDAAPTFADASVAGHAVRVVALRLHPKLEDAHLAQPPPASCSLRYALDRSPLDDILGTLDIILLASLLGACLLVLLATPWLVRQGLRPLSILNAAMAGIGPDAPGGRLPASGTTELTPLVTRFNEVLARMDAGLARERQFAAGLAHEFRTRLAELRTLVDVETRYPSGRDVHRVLSDVGSIGAELEATVTALLQLTRLQAGLEASRMESVALAPLIERASARQADAAQARGLRFAAESTADADARIAADPALLEIILDNLLGNAVAYAPAGTAVELRRERGALVVANAAPTLQVHDLANLGQRFWRKDAHGAGHAGLGLALAGAAARAMDMTLAFELQGGALHARLHWRA